MAGESILIVEDNPTNLKLTTFLLKSEGYDVSTAIDGPESLKLIESIHPDLILMDVQLPGIDGLEVTRRLKKNPKTQSIPVIALTAYAMKGDKEKALEAGCDGYLSKPIDTRMFPSQIRTFLDNNYGATQDQKLVIENILIAEDDEIECEALRARLSAEGYSLSVVSNGAEALVTAKRMRPHLIVSDILMPRLDGFQLCRQIRTSDELRDVHVILTTSGSIQESDEALAKQLGATAFVLKTGDFRHIVESIAAASGHLPPAFESNDTDMAPLRRIFVEEGLEQIATLLKSDREGINVKAARRIAHRWAGTGGTLGYLHISNSASRLATALEGPSPDTETIKNAVSTLEEFFHEAEKQLDT
jgi:two-component system cell cycle response regulator